MEHITSYKNNHILFKICDYVPYLIVKTPWNIKEIEIEDFFFPIFKQVFRQDYQKFSYINTLQNCQEFYVECYSSDVHVLFLGDRQMGFYNWVFLQKNDFLALALFKSNVWIYANMQMLEMNDIGVHFRRYYNHNFTQSLYKYWK